ncbi:MAG: DUF493 domain-containing protein [Bacteriovoracaceae bacterium]|nr:DUF493 domain-containing protein [Bacteriovoracaceae bacterium]
MVNEDYDSFKRRLDEAHEWPCSYLFKFIVPREQVVTLEHQTGLQHERLTPSKKGTYVSVTFHMAATSSDEVIEIYKKASKVKGVMAL